MMVDRAVAGSKVNVADDESRACSAGHLLGEDRKSRAMPSQHMHSSV